MKANAARRSPPKNKNGQRAAGDREKLLQEIFGEKQEADVLEGVDFDKYPNVKKMMNVKAYFAENIKTPKYLKKGVGKQATQAKVKPGRKSPARPPSPRVANAPFRDSPKLAQPQPTEAEQQRMTPELLISVQAEIMDNKESPRDNREANNSP